MEQQNTASKRVSTSVDEDLHFDFKEYCVAARQRISLVDAVDLAMREWLERQKAALAERAAEAETSAA